MINEKVYEENEKCLNCGETFNIHFSLCVSCKSRDNSKKAGKVLYRHKAIEYRDGDMNNHHILVVTVENSLFGEIKLIVPYKSQIANRVMYYVDNGIRDYLEDGLIQENLINFKEFSLTKLNSEDFFIYSELL